MKRDLVKHEEVFVHVPRRWLRWLVMVPAVLICLGLICVGLQVHGFNYSEEIANNSLSIDYTGEAVSYCLIFLGLLVFSFGFAWCNKTLINFLLGGLFGGLFIGWFIGLFVGLLDGLLFGLLDGLLFGLFVGLLFGLFVGLLVSLLFWLGRKE